MNYYNMNVFHDVLLLQIGYSVGDNRLYGCKILLSETTLLTFFANS